MILADEFGLQQKGFVQGLQGRALDDYLSI